MFYSPLRYPGGKNKLAAFIAKICIDNNIYGHYVEPYAGGSSVALFLLLERYVNRITINDKDRSIYAFWYSVLNYTTELCDLVRNTPVDLDTWRVQKEVQGRKETANILELGFSTLFLNRTNRSGILSGGMIGGLLQEGDYKIDCRFNKDEIITRIKTIAERKSQITLHSLDAIELIRVIQNEEQSPNTVFYFDPPYFLKADSLYMNYYKESDHESVRDAIRQITGSRWIVSYDNHQVIRNLYSNFQSKEYSFNHSAHKSREGKEILFFSEGLTHPATEEQNPIDFRLLGKHQKEIKYKVIKKRVKTELSK